MLNSSVRKILVWQLLWVYDCTFQVMLAINRITFNSPRGVKLFTSSIGGVSRSRLSTQTHHYADNYNAPITIKQERRCSTKIQIVVDETY